MLRLFSASETNMYLALVQRVYALVQRILKIFKCSECSDLQNHHHHHHHDPYHHPHKSS